jgi:hypothetical protein
VGLGVCCVCGMCCVCCVCCVCVELKVHSNMCVHECARCAIDLPSWPTNWTAQLGSTTGQHRWPALLTPLGSTNDQHHWVVSVCLQMCMCECMRADTSLQHFIRPSTHQCRQSPPSRHSNTSKPDHRHTDTQSHQPPTHRPTDTLTHCDLKIQTHAHQPTDKPSLAH